MLCGGRWLTAQPATLGLCRLQPQFVSEHEQQSAELWVRHPGAAFHLAWGRRADSDRLDLLRGCAGAGCCGGVCWGVWGRREGQEAAAVTQALPEV